MIEEIGLQTFPSKNSQWRCWSEMTFCGSVPQLGSSNWKLLISSMFN